jgi:hypothetical protein
MFLGWLDLGFFGASLQRNRDRIFDLQCLILGRILFFSSFVSLALGVGIPTMCGASKESLGHVAFLHPEGMNNWFFSSLSEFFKETGLK